MAIKKGKSFSPYSYGIKYRTPGRNPNLKYTYIPAAGGGSNESIYVVTKKEPNFFTYIINHWYFEINDFDEVSFLKCDSDIKISNMRIEEGIVPKDVENIKSSLKIYIEKNKREYNYTWINDSTVKVAYMYNVLSDIVILLNNEFYNEHCEIISKEKSYFEIKFDRNIFSSDEIMVVIYPISSSSDFMNQSYGLKHNNEIEKIDNNFNNNILIKNQFGNINYKYLIFNSDDKLYNLISYNVEPTYIEFNNIDIMTNDNIDVKDIYAYYPNNSVETFIIQYGINEHFISWKNNIVRINHNLNGEINFIIDRNDYRKMIKSIRKINSDNIEIEFFKEKYLPNVFSITIFKVGEA